MSSGTMSGAVVMLLVSYGAVVVALVAAGIRIVQKAGYTAWWVLVALVPVVNLVMFFVFAFGTWPVTKQLEAYRTTSRLSYPVSRNPSTGPEESAPLPPFGGAPTWPSPPPPGGAPSPPPG